MEIINPVIDVQVMQTLMAELREMGLEDIPERPGCRSAMRQYAEATIIVKEHPDEEEMKFVTMNISLLDKAEKLANKYQVRPVHPNNMTLEDENGEPNEVILTTKNLDEVASTLAITRLKESGIDYTKIPEEKFNKLVAGIREYVKETTEDLIRKQLEKSKPK